MRFEVHACGDPGGGKLALLLHGFPEHAHSWRHQLPLLARHGYLAWAPNQRGYGKTTRPEGVEAYRTELLVEDVAALVDAAGCREVILFGHDWGGVVAWLFAIEQVRPLERLVVMNIPHPALFAEALRSNPTQQKRSRYIRFFQIPWLPEFLMRRKGAEMVAKAFTSMAIDKSRFPEADLAVYRENALQPGAATAMLNWYRAARFIHESVEYPLVEVPTLMIWGEEDTALGKELSYGTDELVRDFTVRYLPDVSHWVQQEAPEQVNAILEEWLTR
ncbi:MAG: alpha/beta hydrolase [Deltaproteobacteria bacterium]|nr:alpha/beta hydrolase [Deltaproteobacteria bacterium]MBW2416992.1 alpha/beta hydrolase [Deltaproteobacteria bacterium]